MRLSRNRPLTPIFCVTLSLPGGMLSFAFMLSAPLITGGCVFTARLRKSCIWPAGMSMSRSMMWPLPLMLMTEPAQVNFEPPSVAATGSSEVSPVVPSTMAWKRVCRDTGWFAVSRVKAGVSVLPST